MPAIADLSELKEQVASFLNKTNLTTQIPVFIGLAESMFRKHPDNGGVRVRAQETVATGALTGETLAQPDDLLELRRLTVGDKRILYKTPEEYSLLQQRTVTGSYYTVLGSTIYVLGGNDGDDYELVYQAQFDALDSDEDSNWLLLNAPEVYLWATCYHASVWLKDVAGAQSYLAMYRQAVADLTSSEKKAQTSGPLAIRSDRTE